jgi:hypothetical protein
LEWPDEADETAFLSEASARGEPQAPVADRMAAPTVGARLPPLDELVEKVPADVRAILDDLFRAKFTTVRRYPGSAGTGATP